MPDTYALLVPPNSHAAWLLDDALPYTEQEKTRQNFSVLAKLGIRVDLGGVHNEAIQAAVETDVWQPLEVDLAGDDVAGYTVTLVAFLRTSNAGTTVKARLYNLTDASYATSAETAVSSTSFTRVEMPVTLTSGAVRKFYRLRLLPSNNTNPVYGYGYLRVRAA